METLQWHVVFHVADIKGGRETKRMQITEMKTQKRLNLPMHQHRDNTNYIKMAVMKLIYI